MKYNIDNVKTHAGKSARILLLSALTLLVASCSKEKTVDDIIESKDQKEMSEKRTALQADLSKLDAALASIDGKADEALVSVATVKDTVFNQYLEVQGNVDTKDNLIISPQYSGILTSLNVTAGQQVRKGQVLGRIDDGGLSQQVAQLETQLALAKTTFERQKRLWDQKIGSEIQYLQAQTNMLSQQKAVSQAKAQLAKTVITAPISGVIDEVMTENGEVVAPGKPLMRVINLSNMYISASVPETYIGKLKTNTIVMVELASLGKTYTGKIRQVANNINPANRTFSIEVAVPNSDNLLRPNQVAKLRINDYVNKNALTVPTNVVQEDGQGNKFVFTVSGSTGKSGTAKKMIVKIGKSSDNRTEIIEGLSAGDIIVTEGVNAISEGMKLNF